MNKKSDVQKTSKDRLLESGALLFAEKGYDGTSVREICKKAEVSMNMIHHFFKNKEGLLNVILEEFSSNVLQVPTRLISNEPTSKQDFQSKLELFCQETLEALIEYRIPIVIILRENIDMDAFADYQKQFIWFLKKAQSKKYVLKGVDPEMISGIVLDRFISQVLYAQKIKDTFGCDIINDEKYRRKWLKSNVDFFLFGLAQK